MRPPSPTSARELRAYRAYLPRLYESPPERTAGAGAGLAPGDVLYIDVDKQRNPVGASVL